MSKITELFKKLVSIDSPSGEEKNISDFVMRYLQDLGLNPVQDENFMIYCRVGENPDKLFCAHLDTVEPGRGIVAIEKNGYLVSKGETILGGDNKASLAAILSATSANLNQSFELLFSVREETNSGIQEIDKNLVKSKVGFVFDYGGGDLEVVVQSAPFIIDFEVEIVGKSSHARNPEEGINVINIFNEIVNNTKLGKPDDESTLNIGLLSAGSSTNTVPGQMQFSGDLRSTDQEKFEEHKKSFEKIINLAAEKYEAQAIVKWIPYAFGYNLDENSQNFKILNSIYNNSLQLDDTTSGSDAGFLNHIGIETFCLGDGVENAHSIDERIQIKKLESLEEYISKIITAQF